MELVYRSQMFKCRSRLEPSHYYGATGSSTVTLGKNSANATNTFSINANTTGVFSDTTPHNDSIATGDLIAVEVVAGSSALIIDIIACTFFKKFSHLHLLDLQMSPIYH